MSSKRIRFGALAFAAAAVLGTVGSVTTATVANAAPAFSPMRAQAPSTGELRSGLAVAFNANASRAARAAELEGGESGLPAFDRAAMLISIAPASWRWDVTGPVTQNGDVTSAVLYTATDGYEPWTFDVTWKLIDGKWKFSRESTCTIANFVGASC
ncbi:hypothetical protein JK358_22780 [Nocardia sp. 2]|uniref:Low molecular weight antigen MTB12-like C-terminal domain-containing protein n=1 Tax=Nocardia acididurans TaxID=2802282 RepID=A0ABS1MBU2_9NOCA|nr:hypothetical protein [Nocardia acididurans]MBL1077229.1 hypothetical protein [Nocardia acididurans]